MRQYPSFSFSWMKNNLILPTGLEHCHYVFWHHDYISRVIYQLSYKTQKQSKCHFNFDLIFYFNPKAFNLSSYRQTLGTILAGLWCLLLDLLMREYPKLKKHKREVQVRVIGSKLEIAHIVHRKCTFLLNNMFEDRKKQCCVMCDKLSWLVWNFNMLHFNFYVFELV